MAVGMLLDYVGEKPAAAAIESAIIELLKRGELKGVGTGVHRCSEVGEMVASQLKAAGATV